MTTYQMWDKVPGMCQEVPVIEYYQAENRRSDASVVIFPGGAYGYRAPHEGVGYAEMLNKFGIDAFVCEYRVFPHQFPIELLDARRAVRWVRAHAAEFGLDPERIAVMGSSAGGHLAALVSTYAEPIAELEGVDEIDSLPYLPNATILCYAVNHMPDDMKIAHLGTYERLLGDFRNMDCSPYSPDLLVNDGTPQAFIWHTAADEAVNVINSYLYATACRRHNVPVEMHIFPNGRHGLGVANDMPHVAQWTGLLKNWFIDIGWLSE